MFLSLVSVQAWSVIFFLMSHTVDKKSLIRTTAPVSKVCCLNTEGLQSSTDVVNVQKVLDEVNHFYQKHDEIKVSHGISHVMAVYQHAVKAISCHVPPLSSTESMEIQVTALLHDVDDKKYFPNHGNYENARSILKASNVPDDSCRKIVRMIQLVSCSANGNHVPQDIIDEGAFHLLIPRWADRLEAVGAIGVLRCYQFNREHDMEFSTANSPRAQTEAEVWNFATQERFEAYQARGGSSTDMISHYYDKLLHVACPPNELVRNPYLEQKAKESSKELLEVCLRYGKTGTVDEEYIQDIAKKLLVRIK
jgi:uncharacterized protein